MFPTIIYFVPVKIWKDISVSNMLTEESFIVALYRLKSLQNEEDCVTTYVVQKIWGKLQRKVLNSRCWWKACTKEW